MNSVSPSSSNPDPTQRDPQKQDPALILSDATDNTHPERLHVRLFLRKEGQPPSRGQELFNGLLVGGFIAAFFILTFQTLDYTPRWNLLWLYRDKVFTGFLNTLVISGIALVLSLFIGLLTALSSRSRLIPLVTFGRMYIGLIRNTPLMVQIIILFYVVGTALHITNRYLLGALILSFFSGAYVSEIIRAGIESIPASQIESGLSLGFTRFQLYRYVILPQVAKRITPGIAGQLVSLVKDSSLLSIIAVSEVTKVVQEIDSLNYATIETFIQLAGLYLLITLPLSALAKRLERQFAYEN